MYIAKITEKQKMTGNITIGERGPQGEPGATGAKGDRGEPGGTYIHQQNITNNANEITILSNLFYNIENSSENFSFVFSDEVYGLCNEYCGQITTTVQCVITFPAGSIISNTNVSGNSIMLGANKTCEFSSINGKCVVIVYD